MTLQRIDAIDERRRIFIAPHRRIYVLREGDVAVTYERTPELPGFYAFDKYASVNTHAKTNVTGVMTRDESATCEFLDHDCSCWFDGTSLAPAQANDEDIWRLLERWLPREEANA